MVHMDTLEGELRDESKDGVEAELALKKCQFLKSLLKNMTFGLCQDDE